MSKQHLTITISQEELNNLEAYCQQTQRTKSDVISEYLRDIHKKPEEHLLSEISRLSKELEEIKKEKAQLETLLETTECHNKSLENQQAKEQLEAVLGAIPGYVSWLDNQGKYLGVNTYLANSLNLLPQDFVGKELGFMQGGQEFSKFIKNFIDSSETSVSKVVEVSINNRNCSYLVVACKYKQNQETVVVGIDITERQQAEMKLQQTHDQLQAVIDAVPGLVSWFDSQGNYLGVNQHLANKFNISGSTFVGKKVGFIEGNSQFSDLIYQFLASPNLRTSQIVAISIQGDLRYYLIAVQKYQQSQASVCIGIDITEHKKAELALHESEERFRSLVANIPGAIYRCQWNRNWKIEFISNAIYEISGYPASDLIHSEKRNYLSIIHPDDQKFVQQTIEQSIKNKAPYNLEYRIINANHKIRLVHEQGRGVCDISGNLLYLDGVIFDITENEEIMALNEQLKEENLRMGAELNVARQIQMMILPKHEELENIKGLNIAGYMEPADEVGGDYYDVLETDGVVTLGIGDVTGHGLESGILMLMTQTAVRTLQEIQETDPVVFLDTINRTIYKNVQRMNSDKSLTLAIINYADGKISISGQHEETLIVRKNGEIERVDTIDLGFPIGLDEEISKFINHANFELQKGDGIVLYTDGITEAQNINKIQYQLERLCTVISANWDKSVSEIKDEIISDLRKHIGTQKVFDDITLLILKRQE